jgi:hypothetical protein
MLNRTVIIIKAKQPFLDWYLSLTDPNKHQATLEELNLDAAAYLIPECDDDDQVEKLLKHHYQDIFDAELLGWWTRKEDWPQKRTYKMFRNWFDIEFHTEIRDLSDEPLEDDGFD